MPVGRMTLTRRTIVPSGSATFNGNGTFNSPFGVQRVIVTGRGAPGNAGNNGTPGNNGNGGLAGNAGTAGCTGSPG